MTIISGTRPLGEGETAAPLRADDVANRQDSWLRQMELASLARHPGEPAGAQGAAPPRTLAAPPARQPSAAHAGRPDHAPQADAGSEARGAQDRRLAEPVRAGGSGRGPATDDGTEAAGTRGTHALAHTQCAGPAPAIAQPAPQAFGATGAAAVQAGLPVMAAQPAAKAGSAATAGDPAPAARLRLPAAFGATLAGRGEPPAPEATTPAAEPQPQETERARQESADWQKRHMHLVTDEGQVDVWIRDQALQGRQLTQVVARLAGELAGMGLQLRDATVNGRHAGRFRPDARGAAEITAATDGGPTDLPLQEIRHGA